MGGERGADRPEPLSPCLHLLTAAFEGKWSRTLFDLHFSLESLGESLCVTYAGGVSEENKV